ncbi:lipoprotein insertase outer membrane protein LolB [Luteimonas sp. e5]
MNPNPCHGAARPASRLSRLAWPLLLVLLAGCAGRELRAPAGEVVICDSSAGDADSAQCGEWIAAVTARQAAVDATHATGGWSMHGRAAISHARQSGNARIEWQQRGREDYSVTLSAPVTRQSWRLDVDATGAVISGLPEGSRQGPDAAALLREASGWDIPVAQMPAWLQGHPARGEPVQRHVFAMPDGRLVGFDQAGWRIELVPDAQGRPRRITAERGESRVRLVVDAWGEAADD